ncbi:hypothetical protein StoSoilB13_08110 [Arthrobacter sp. StoSoilB13]|nr:hypothetical protein StoSoilB13_08110 [Arthrobacter sp. StoSoilB13]
MNTCFDLEGGIGRDEFFEPGNVAAVVIGAAQAGRKRPVHGIVIHQELQLFKHAGPVFGVMEAFNFPDIRMTRDLAGLAPDVGPLAQELFTQCRDIHHRVPTLLAGAAGVLGRILAAGWLTG